MLEKWFETHSTKIQSLCDNAGKPFYVFNLDYLRNHIQSLKSALPEFIDLYYATKANPMLSFLKVIQSEGLGVDIASTGELAQAKLANFSSEKMLATGPAKSKIYLETLVESEIKLIVIESENQLIWLNEIASTKNITQDILLRVQLDWEEMEGDSVLGGQSITPFGLSDSDWLKVDLKKLKNLNVLGLHLFQWGNITSSELLMSIWENVALRLSDLASKLEINFEVLDLGGGLGISYSDDDVITISKLSECLSGIKEKYKLKSIILEIGRFISAESGIYLNKIIDKKSVRQKDLLVMEGGINHIARVALTNESFPCCALNKKSSASLKFKVHGPLCTSLDDLGEYDLPVELNVNDWLIFHKTGAYSLTESMPYFLCHDFSSLFILNDGEINQVDEKSAGFCWK